MQIWGYAGAADLLVLNQMAKYVSESNFWKNCTGAEKLLVLNEVVMDQV